MNSSETTQTNGKLLWGLAKDHLELASLEWNFEKQKGWRRFLVGGAGAILLVSSYIFFHVALCAALIKTGMTWINVGFYLGTVYLLVGAGILWFCTRREPEVGIPMKGSREEIKRSLNWIEKRFF